MEDHFLLAILVHLLDLAILPHVLLDHFVGFVLILQVGPVKSVVLVAELVLADLPVDVLYGDAAQLADAQNVVVSCELHLLAVAVDLLLVVVVFLFLFFLLDQLVLYFLLHPLALHDHHLLAFLLLQRLQVLLQLLILLDQLVTLLLHSLVVHLVLLLLYPHLLLQLLQLLPQLFDLLPFLSIRHVLECLRLSLLNSFLPLDLLFLLLLPFLKLLPLQLLRLLPLISLFIELPLLILQLDFQFPYLLVLALELLNLAVKLFNLLLYVVLHDFFIHSFIHSIFHLLFHIEEFVLLRGRDHLLLLLLSNWRVGNLVFLSHLLNEVLDVLVLLHHLINFPLTLSGTLLSIRKVFSSTPLKEIMFLLRLFTRLGLYGFTVVLNIFVFHWFYGSIVFCFHRIEIIGFHRLDRSIILWITFHRFYGSLIIGVTFH